MFTGGQLGASFFCSRDSEDQSNLRLIFPTLAVQLARRCPAFQSIFVPLVQSDPGIAHESLYNQMKNLIVKPLKESSMSTVIIIDALDECKDEESTSVILSILGQFVSEIPKVKFLLTSRPEPQIQEGFHLLPLAEATEVFSLHAIEPNQVDGDIQLFLKHKFSELAHRQGSPDNWPTREQLGLLCKRAAGLFVYAVATVKFIDHRNENPINQLDHILRSPKSTVYEGRTRFKSNATLDSVYLSILQGAFGDGDLEDDERARSVIGAMVLATRPLSPSSIATLLGLHTEGVFLRLLSIHSLLTLKDVNCPVSPFHNSFPDFIVDSTRCVNQRFHIFPPTHHMKLLIGCLNLMDQSLRKNMCKIPDVMTNSEVDDLKERTKQYINHTLQYACESWHTHLVAAYTMPAHTQQIISILHQFLEKKFLFWLEVLSVLGTVRIAVDALESAASCLEVC